MKKTNAGYLFRVGRQALALMVVTVGTAWAQTAMPSLTYDVVETRYVADGDGIVTRETHAMRRDGSTVTITPLQGADGTQYELRRIQDLAQGRTSQVNTAVHTVTSSPIQQTAVDRFLNGPGRSCGAPMDAMRVTFGTYDGLRFSTINDKTETVRLVAPQLGCISLLTVFREDGKVTGIRQVENIRRGEPDPALFTVPADYREASAAEAPQRAIPTG